MRHLTILSILLLSIVPTIISIYMSCYFNARLILPPSALLYNSLTLQSCKCLMTQPNVSGFQYDSNNQSCYTFGNDSSRANLRVQTNSQVCFLNQIATVCYRFFLNKRLSVVFEFILSQSTSNRK